MLHKIVLVNTFIDIFFLLLFEEDHIEILVEEDITNISHSKFFINNTMKIDSVTEYYLHTTYVQC